MLLSLPWLVHGWYDATFDTPIYILCARSILAGEGYAFLDQPFRLRPPGFSVLLTPVLALFGTNFLALNLTMSLFGVATVAGLFAYQVRRLGVWASLAVAAVIWLNPLFRTLCNQILSELPSTAILMACLLWERRLSRAPSMRGDILLGVMIGLAGSVRTINLLLVPCILLARVLNRRMEGTARTWLSFLRARCLTVVTVPLLLLLPWSVRNAVTEFPTPPDQYHLHSYWVATWHTDKGDPDSPVITVEEFLERSKGRSLQALGALGSRLESDQPDWAYGTVGLLLLLCTAIVAARYREPGEILALGTFAVVSVYFAFADRLVLPVYLLGFPSVVAVAKMVIERFSHRRLTRWLLPALLAGLAVWDFAPRASWPKIEEVHRKLTVRSREVAEIVPADARLATILGNHYAVLLERPVFSFSVVLRRTGDVGVVEEVIDRHRIDTVFLFEDAPYVRRLIAYFEKNYGLSTRAGNTLLFHVRQSGSTGMGGE
jgi:hypothetical protein